VFHDLTTNALFRAQAAVTGPFLQAFSAVGVIILPLLRRSNDSKHYLRTLIQGIGLIVSAGIVCTVLIGVFGDKILIFLYKGKYSLSPIGYWLAGSYPCFIGISFILGSAIRALDRPDIIARITFLSCIIVLPVGLVLAYMIGVEGALIGQVLAGVFMSVATARVIWRFRQQLDHLIGAQIHDTNPDI
jgi:O-antigen/teichoic acid export membrane protein